jgi:uncharacterized protein
MRMRRASALWLAAMFFISGLSAVAQAKAGLDAAGTDLSAVALAKADALLADAVQRRDQQAVLSLLQQGADVNAPQSDGATALHWATYLEDADTTALLIRAGARVDQSNQYGMTPLALAAASGNARIIDQLLKAGADPNRAVRAGETPLMLAARTDRADAVKVLLSAGAHVDAKENWNGQTALMWAAAAGNGPIVQTLIDRGADIRARSNAGTTPLLFAVRRGDRGTVGALLAAGADVNDTRPDRATPLLVAVINGHADLVDLLLDKGADPNVEGGSTELTVQGVRARPMELKYRRLTNNERDSEGVTRGNIFGTPLHAAIHVANWHISDQFIGVQIDRLRVIKALLAHGADVNRRLTMEEPRWSGARYRRHLTGATPLLLAAKSADVEVMRVLLAHGADSTINTEEQITPLMAAAGIAWASNQDKASESQVLEAVKLLVEEQRADVNFVSDLGETAMHAAAYRGANSVVQYLFDKGARLDVVAVDGRTPLIIADGVEYGNSFAAQPHTAVLLRKLGAKEMKCPPPCAAAIPDGKVIKR